MSDETLFDLLPSSFDTKSSHRHLVISNAPRPSDESRIIDIVADGLDAIQGIVDAVAALPDDLRYPLTQAAAELHLQAAHRLFIRDATGDALEQLTGLTGERQDQHPSLAKLHAECIAACRLFNRATNILSAEWQIALFRSQLP